MKAGHITGMAGLLSVFIGSGLSGCATSPQTLYYWGDYQPQVYAYFKGESQNREAQQAALQQAAQKAAAEGKALPPGFNAHLGLLYLKAGQPEKAQTAFRTEEVSFPESRAYIDFLLENFNRQTTSSAQ